MFAEEKNGQVLKRRSGKKKSRKKKSKKRGVEKRKANCETDVTSGDNITSRFHWKSFVLESRVWRDFFLWFGRKKSFQRIPTLTGNRIL